MIRTVTGDIDAAALGYCQSHEHIFLRKGRSYELNPALCMEDYGATVQELASYRAAGGVSLVDAQPVGCGRMARSLQAASEESGVRVIASTGFHKLTFYRDGHWILGLAEDSLAVLWTEELSLGMLENADDALTGDRLGCRAGVIKIAVDAQGVSGRYPALLCAAAEASTRSGMALLCHVEAGADAFELVRFLTDRGVPPGKIILCHMDRANPDQALHLELLREGVYLEFDTIARYAYHSDEFEARLIENVLAHGFARRMLLGLDTTAKRLRAYGGATGLNQILCGFLPLLREHGISDEAIGLMTAHNPAEAFSFSPAP